MKTKTKYLYFENPNPYRASIPRCARCKVYRKQIGIPGLRFWAGVFGWPKSETYPKLTKEFKRISLARAKELEPSTDFDC